jgi:hypothetical protein
MKRVWISVGFLLLILSPARSILAQETEIPGVTAHFSHLRQYNGVLRLAISLKNTTDKRTAAGALDFSKLVLVDAQSKKNTSP